VIKIAEICGIEEVQSIPDEDIVLTVDDITVMPDEAYEEYINTRNGAVALFIMAFIAMVVAGIIVDFIHIEIINTISAFTPFILFFLAIRAYDSAKSYKKEFSDKMPIYVFTQDTVYIANASTSDTVKSSEFHYTKVPYEEYIEARAYEDSEVIGGGYDDDVYITTIKHANLHLIHPGDYSINLTLRKGVLPELMKIAALVNKAINEKSDTIKIEVEHTVKTPDAVGRTECPYCGASFIRKMAVCPHCGALLAKGIRKCPKCGTSIQPGFVFCPKCGTSLHDALEQ